MPKPKYSTSQIDDYRVNMCIYVLHYRAYILQFQNHSFLDVYAFHKGCQTAVIREK